MEIVYCDTCGYRIPDMEFEDGRATRVHGRAVCQKCQPAKPLGTSSKATNEKVTGIAKRSSMSRVTPATDNLLPTRTPIPGPGVREDPIQTPSGIRHAMPKKEGSPMMMIGGLSAVGIVVLLVIAVGAGGSSNNKKDDKSASTPNNSANTGNDETRPYNPTSNGKSSNGNSETTNHSSPDIARLPVQQAHPQEKDAQALFDVIMTVTDVELKKQRLEDFVSRYHATDVSIRAGSELKRLKAPPQIAEGRPISRGAGAVEQRPVTPSGRILPANVLHQWEFEKGDTEGWRWGALENKTTYKGSRGALHVSGPKDGNYTNVEYESRDFNLTVTDATTISFAYFLPEKIQLSFIAWAQGGNIEGGNAATEFKDLKVGEWGIFSFKVVDHLRRGVGYGELVKPGVKLKRLIFSTPTRPGANDFFLDEITISEGVIQTPAAADQASRRSAVLFKENFENETTPGLTYGKVVTDAPAGVNGKALKFSMEAAGGDANVRAGFFTFSFPVGSQQQKSNTLFPLVPGAIVRLRYYSGSAIRFDVLVNTPVEGEKDLQAFRGIIRNPVAGAWTQIDIPLSDFKHDTRNLVPGNSSNCLSFFAYGKAPVVFYVDDIEVLSGTAEAPAPEVVRKNVSREPATAENADPYTAFLDEFFGFLSRYDLAGADKRLREAEENPELASRKTELVEDRKTMELLAELNAAVALGADKLLEIASFELRQTKGASMSVGKNARFKMGGIKDGVINLVSEGVTLPVPLESLEKETRMRLSDLGMTGTRGVLAMVLRQVLALDVNTDASSFSAARSSIDRLTGGHTPETHSMRRFVEQLETRSKQQDARESSAVRDWREAQKLYEAGIWKECAAALTAFNEKHGAAKIALANAEQIKTMQARSTDMQKLDVGLVGHWKFDEGSGTSTTDSTANKYEGTLIGGPTWVPGKNGAALQFDGKDDYIQLPTADPLDRLHEKNYSVCAWYKPDSRPTGSGPNNVAQHGIVIRTGWHLGLTYTSAGKFTMMHRTIGDMTYVAESTPFAIGVNYHLVGTVNRDDGWVRIYVNGVMIGEKKFEPKTAARSFPKEGWKVGFAGLVSKQWAHHHPAKGIIDDVRLYNRALTENDVQLLYSQEKKQ
jgi:hypothetical protein